MPSSRSFDILIVGAGPTGMAAAVAASARGRTIGVVDDNPGPGGQIWRGGREKPTSREAANWFQRIRSARFESLDATQVLGPLDRGRLLAESEGEAVELGYGRLILATGARELFLPFPGWTLPNVMGAGGLQAMVKSGLPIAGKRVVIAGSGPLLLAVADYLKRRGAEVRLVAEQAPIGQGRGIRYGTPGASRRRCVQALGLSASTANIRIKAGCWPVAADGRGLLEAGRTHRRPEDSWREPMRLSSRCRVRARAERGAGRGARLCPAGRVGRRRRLPEDHGPRRLRRGRGHRDRRARPVARRGRDRRARGEGRRGRGPVPLPPARPGPRVRPSARSGVRPPRRVAIAGEARHDRLSLRGRPSRRAHPLFVVDGGQAPDPMRDGAVPGPYLRRGGEVALRMGAPPRPARRSFNDRAPASSPAEVRRPDPAPTRSPRSASSWTQTPGRGICRCAS